MQRMPPETPVRRSPLISIFLTVAIDLLGFGIVLPLLPLYADTYGASELTIGLLFASFSGMQFLTAPLWGRASDRHGRRPVILLGLFGSFLSYVLFGLAEALPEPLVLLFASRIAAGLFGGTIGTAYAYIADTTTPQERGRGMALIGAAFGIGFTIGPALGGLGYRLHPMAPGFLAAGFSALAFLHAWRYLAEPAGRTRTQRRTWLDLAALRGALGRPGIALLLAMLFTTVSCFALMESTLGLLAKRVHGLEIADVGWLFTYLGFWIAIAQGLVVRRLMKRVGEVVLLRAGTLLLAVGLILLGYARDIWWVLAVAPLGVLGFACVAPSAQALISRRTAPDRQGEVLGVSQSLQSLSRLIGPLAGLSLFGVAWELPFEVGAAGMAVAFVAAWWVHAPTAAEPAPTAVETA